MRAFLDEVLEGELIPCLLCFQRFTFGGVSPLRLLKLLPHTFVVEPLWMICMKLESTVVEDIALTFESSTACAMSLVCNRRCIATSVFASLPCSVLFSFVASRRLMSNDSHRLEYSAIFFSSPPYAIKSFRALRVLHSAVDMVCTMHLYKSTVILQRALLVDTTVIPK